MVPRPGETAPEEGYAAVITAMEDRDANTAAADAAAVNADPLRRVNAVVLSERPDRPVTQVPALSRFRLVHESPTNVTWDLISGESVPTGISKVKVFEYVRGARIRGNGVIELPLETNTGRVFTYRQESIDGEFIVPYSTRGNPYEVRATGPYRIVGSAATFEVTEEDVLSGNTVG
jgi:dolichyl-diphosphooligosaccharide--protein glycosyltransferase